MLHSIGLHNDTIHWVSKFPSHPEFPKTIKCVVAGALLGVAISFATGTYLPITFTAGVIAGFLVDRLIKGLSVWMEDRARAEKNREVERCMDRIERDFFKYTKRSIKKDDYNYKYDYEHDCPEYYALGYREGTVKVEEFTLKKQTQDPGNGQLIELPGRKSIYRDGKLDSRKPLD